jgi:hypothetical protein
MQFLSKLANDIQSDPGGFKCGARAGHQSSHVVQSCHSRVPIREEPHWLTLPRNGWSWSGRWESKIPLWIQYSFELKVL